MTAKIGIITILGAGLIGSSMARAFKHASLAEHIVLCDRDDAVIATAKTLGLADQYETDLSKAVCDADCIILAIPVGEMGKVMEKISGNLKQGSIISDVGSVKSSVIDVVAPHIPEGVHFVPGHPVAGTEKSGPEAGFTDLFKNRWMILTPLTTTDKSAVTTVKYIWESVGSIVEIMDAKHHDLVLAITSHVPHLIAYNIVGTASDLERVTQSEVIKFSAGGFRDFTRIAASDPTMWRDIFLNNKEAVLEMLGRFNEDLTQLQRAIRWDDGDALFDLFTRTREIRRGIIDAGQEIDSVDFGRPHGKLKE